MLFVIIVLVAVFSVSNASPYKKRRDFQVPQYHGDYNPCNLNIWPWPQAVECDTSILFKLSEEFYISTNHSSPRLSEIIARYHIQLYQQPVVTSRGYFVEPQFIFEGQHLASTALKSLQVLVDDVSNAPKQLDDDESYTLDINSDGATLQAATIWGVIYGLETFTQLLSPDMVVPALRISDAPRYPWRGLLVDTANHFLPLSTLKKFIDGMAAVKLNTLHWHIVDSYSFPLVSSRYPDLARHGAWTNGAVYSHHDIAAIVDYASHRGVRVVVELDMPGHAYSWGLSDALQAITTACPRYTDELGHIDDVPLDPTQSLTYDVVTSLVEELTQLLPDLYFHIGGDEVKYGCWSESQGITDFMSTHHISTYYELEQLFLARIANIVTNQNRKMVAWEEVFFNASGGTTGAHGDWIGSKALPPSTTIVESWTGPDYLAEAISHGYDGILAYGWYLDRQNPIDDETTWFYMDSWAQMYAVDVEPTSSKRSESSGRALGGEASIWTEQADEVNIESVVWPRAAAAAERLWSAPDITDTAAAATRLSTLRCRLIARYALRAGPVWSDLCSASADLV